MKKIIICILIVSILILLYFIWNKSEQELGDSYYFLPKYEAIDIGYPGGAIVYKSSHKYVFSDIKITKDVICAKSNGDYIIAIQQTKSHNRDRAQTDSMIDDSLKYYIINKKLDKVYGPYSKDEYLEKRVALKIPKKLSFSGNIR